jgi:type I restriction enzyme, S subunit
MAHEDFLFGSLFNNCPADWKIVPFPEAVDFQEGPGILAKDFHNTGVPLLRLSSVQRATASLEGCNYLDPEKVFSKWNHFRLNRGDLLISTSATLGMVSEVDEQTEGAVAYTGLIRLRPKTEQIYLGFIKYFAKSRLFVRQAEGMAVGSVLRHFGPSHLRQMAFPIPPLKEQIAIADILRALDDKIEVIREMNETLEALAQTIFKSRFIETTTSKLPQGWNVRALYDCAGYINGAAFRNEHFSTDGRGLPVVKIAELKDGITAQTKFCEEAREPKYRIASGDILFSWSGSPDTSIDIFVWAAGDGWLNQHIFKIQFKRPIEKLFVYNLLRHLKPEFIEIARNKQTTGLGHVTGQDLKRLQAAFPPDDVLQEFNRVAEPLFQKVYCNLCESRTLVELLDTLLPKLLTGEIRVPFAAEQVKEAIR